MLSTIAVEFIERAWSPKAGSLVGIAMARLERASKESVLRPYIMSRGLLEIVVEVMRRGLERCDEILNSEVEMPFLYTSRVTLAWPA